MTDSRYNGWTNYETWNVNLWMTNDEGSSEHWAEKAQDAYDSAESDQHFTREERATITLSESLKDDYEDQWQDILESAGSNHYRLSSSMWADLMGAALSEVNWHEIAEHLMDDCDKASETEPAEAE